MQALYLLNIALALAMLFWPVWFSRSSLKLPALNPFTIALLLDLPIQIMKLFVGPMVLIDDGLFNAAYQYALLMGSVLSIAQLASLIFFFRGFAALRVERHIPLSNVRLSPCDLARASRAFLLVYWFAMYQLASSDFGVLNWLANPREGYQLHRVGLGHWYALAISALSIAMTLSFLANPATKSLLWRAPLFIGLAYLFGSKTILLSIFGALLTFLWFLQWKHLTRLLLTGAPVIFSLMLWNLYLALADVFDLRAVLEYFDYYKNAADYYRALFAGDIQLFHGEVALTSLWAYVPRTLFPEKPFVYGVVNINEFFFPGQAELTNTPAFGGAVEQYADFGVPGVVLAGFFSAQSFVTALLAHLIFKRPGLRFHQMTLAMALAVIMQFAPAFGTFFPGALYLLLVAAVALLIAVLRRRRRVRRPLAAGNSAIGAQH